MDLHVHSYPEILQQLLTGNHKKSKHFLTNIRQFNSAFQMTSFGCQEQRLIGWQPTFSVRGQIHHRIGSLLNEPHETPAYCQIYFIDDEYEQADGRVANFNNLDVNLVLDIQQLLHANNKYVHAF